MENQAEYKIENTVKEVSVMSDFDFLRGVQSSLVEHKASCVFDVKKWENNKDKFFVEMFKKQLADVEISLNEVTRRLSEYAKARQG